MFKVLLVLALVSVAVQSVDIITGAYNKDDGMCLVEHNSNLFGIGLFGRPNMTKIDQSLWTQTLYASFSGNANPTKMCAVVINGKACMPGYPAANEATTVKNIFCTDLASTAPVLPSQLPTGSLSDVAIGNLMFFKNPSGTSLYYTTGVVGGSWHQMSLDSNQAKTGITDFTLPVAADTMNWVVVPATGNFVYLANTTCILKFDTTSNTMTFPFCLPTGEQFTTSSVLTKDDAYIVSTGKNDNNIEFLFKFQISNSSIVGNITLGSSSVDRRLALNPRGDYVYLVLGMDSTVKQIVVSTFTVATSVTVSDIDANGHSVLIPSAGGALYLAGYNTANPGIRRYPLDCSTKGHYMVQFGNSSSCAACATGYAQSVSALSCTACPSGATCSNGLCSGSSDCVFFSAASALQALGSLTLLGLAVLVSMTSSAF